jgi:hypothetical protein
MEDGGVSEAGNKLIAGLQDALAFTQGDASKGRVTLVGANEALAAAMVDWPAAKAAIADFERALKRIAKRAQVAPSFERVEIVQHRGATIEFSGRLLARDEFVTRGNDPMRIEFEIWESAAGALIAVRSSEPAEREGVEIVWATVVETGPDPLAMHCAVMDAFDWQDRARSMARKLGWSLRVEVA